MTNTLQFRPAIAARRAALLHSVSLGALMVAGGTAQAAPLRSLSQALGLANHAAQAAIAPSNAVSASQQAALGSQNLARAATRLRSLTDALATAGNTSPAASPIVVDGFGAGTGLQVTPGTLAGGATWQGASLPTSAATSKGITVTVTQNQPLARLTWQSFNVGRKTTLDFNQSAGGTLASSWIVINTVLDPRANPAQILGDIEAPGKVYILDRNGIAFTQGSTVNVGALVATTADIYAGQFTTSATGQTAFSLYSAQAKNIDTVTGLALAYRPTFVNGSAAGITVDAGATIQTAAPTGTNGGGSVLLLGGNVANAGLISTPLGQTVLAAGTQFTIRQGTQGSTTAGNLASTTLGAEVAATNYGTNTNTGFLGDVPTDLVYSTGSATNTGIVLADQGDISLVGHALTQAGVLMSTTTVNQRGTIHLLTPNDGTDELSSITLAPGSVTEILPEDDGLVALDSQRATNIAGSAVLNAYRVSQGTVAPRLNNSVLLTDQLGESRVEMSSGGSVDVGAGALVVAQGGQIAVAGGSRVLVETGANLDVSGTTSAILPASVNDLLVNVQPFQLRDSAANRTGGLKGTNVYVDAATLIEVASGAFAGNVYTPGGLLEVSGYLGLIPHGIGEWTAIGGQVTLQAAQAQLTALGALGPTVSGAVITQPGATINLQGGTVAYQGGQVNQTYVQASDGTIYNVNTAPGNLVYDGIYSGFEVNHPRWHVTEHFNNQLLTPATTAVQGYTVGRDAGSITINAATDVLQGAVYAGVTVGQFQDSPRPTAITDPYLLTQTVLPQAGTLSLGNYVTGVLQTLTTPTQIVFQATQGPLPGLGATIAPPVLDSAIIDAPVLDADGLASFIASTGGNITVASPIAVATGGTVSLTGANITVDAGITARSGAITLTDQLSTTGLPVAYRTSITVAPGVALDTRGVWTNGQTNDLSKPAGLAGLGFVAGGTITIAGSNNVNLLAGSRLDVSSGGALLANGAQVTGRGGSVTIVADEDIVPSQAGSLNLSPVTLASTIAGYGSAGGGTLSITAPEIQVGGTGPGPFITVALDPALFSTGFGRYAVNGTALLTVEPGTQISVAEPIYLLGQGAALAVPTGGDPSSAYSVVLPALYTPTRGTDALTERAGASIALFSSVGPAEPLAGQGGPLIIGAGAGVSVDPGQSIVVAGYGQVSVFGTLTAHGGSIQVASTSSNPDQNPIQVTTLQAAQFALGQSVWIGAQGLLDVSGQAVVQTDGSGATYGIAPSGGTITLGSYTPAQPTLAEVIVRPGAVLDANGAVATVDVVPNTVAGALPLAAHQAITLAGNGGTISADSALGVALDGTLEAHAGAADAAGGALSLTLDPINLGYFTNLPTATYQPRRIEVSTLDGPALAAPAPAAPAPGMPAPGTPALQAGAAFDPAANGLIHLSQQQIDAGGFDAVSLSATSAEIIFDGNVALRAGRSLSLAAAVIGDAAAVGAVRLYAPLVTLSGDTQADFDNNNAPGVPQLPSAASLTISADLIEIGNTLDLGGSQSVAAGTSSVASASGSGTLLATGIGAPAQGVTTTSFSFGQASFDSAGDIRFLGSPSMGTGTLASGGNLTFSAGQIYPASQTRTDIIAGANPVTGSGIPLSDGGTILITGNGSVAQAPYSVGGGLDFIGDTIVQGGTVRAPEGNLAFDDGANVNFSVYYPSQVTFLPGSVTSVSLAGQTIPFGGTVDGVTYLPPGGGAVPLFQPSITVGVQLVDAMAGATLDLRGGGTLSGAGFVFGRGGTADVLTTPLLDTTGGAAVANAAGQVAAIQPVRSNDPVYAILPGYQSSYAPQAAPGDAAYTATHTGEQITVAAGEVAGLAAGTYTLLPAYYALLPGGYRVELATGALPPGVALPQGNFTVAAPVTIGTANTPIAAPVQSIALFTTSADIRQLSQYDEESYNTFEALSATQFGAPRPFLPQDAKTLDLNYFSVSASATALAIAPSALLIAPQPGGYGATLEINTPNPLVITGPGDAAPVASQAGTASVPSLVIPASVFSPLDLPRLVLGGTLSVNIAASNTIDVNALAASVDITPHAVLSAGDVLVTAVQNGAITVEPGAVVSTLGEAPAAYDNSNGYFFNTEYSSGAAYPALDISNGRIVFTPNTDSAAGASISVGDGSALLAGDSLNVVAPNQTVVAIGNADLRALTATIAVAAVNIGDQAALTADAASLPSGLNLTPSGFLTLLNIGTGGTTGTQLTLTATQDVDLIGSFTLDTRVPTGPTGTLVSSTDLVLNTPAIYGVGTASDAVAIDLRQFTWSGVATQGYLALNPNGITTSALPGGQIAASLGQASGALSINAGTIVLGYGPQTQPNDQVTLGRLVSGFDAVTLSASSVITANNESALSVFATQTVFGQPGTGGDLSLVTPLLTTQSAAVLKLTAGGALRVTAPDGLAPASTAGVTTLGGEIDLTASSIDIATAVALPAGQLNAVAQTGIDLASGGAIDLSGRTVHLFDQSRAAPGGTLTLESTAGSITLDAGSTIDVAATAAAAGSVSLSALAGGVAVDGTLLGSADAGQTGGSFSVIAGTLSSSVLAANLAAGASAFDAVNAALNTGGFTASRSFEIGTDIGPSGAATTTITIENDTAGHALVAASTVNVTADLGSIDVTGTIDASGTGPGSIMLAAQQNLTLETTALLDAHASRTATDSYGQPIDAENRAHATLTSTAGTLLLLGGTVDLSYPGQATTGAPQGQLVLNAQRVGTDDVAITAAAPFTVTGAQSIALYAWRTYLAQNVDGTVAQSYGGYQYTSNDPILSLNVIDADSTAFMTAAGANTALAGRLAGLAAYGAAFHLRPGVEIDSTAASRGNITITGDVDLSGYRYSDVGYGSATVAGIDGSGEAGAILFRAANDLIVNGSVSDGFAPSPDKRPANYLPADGSWIILAPPLSGGSAAPDQLNADIILPSSITISTTLKGVTTTVHKIELIAGTTFDESRAISLNYAITIASASVAPNAVIPFAATIDPNSGGVTVPQGGFVTTAAITGPTGTVIPAGTFLAGGTLIAPGSQFAAGSVFPVSVQVAQNTVVPGGTLLSIFNDNSNTLTLSKRTGGLPDNALIPSNTVPQFAEVDGTPVYRLFLRPHTVDAAGHNIEGALYALAALLPAGSQSWNLDLVAGANQASADVGAVLPHSVLAGGALAAPANTANQAPGSLILDDQHYVQDENEFNLGLINPAFSVIRTGTGNLSLQAGGDFDQSSLYGIYTAGTQDPLASGNDAFNLAREGVNGNNFITPGGQGTTVNAIVRETYQANYPNEGGDVLVAAQGSVTGDVIGGQTGDSFTGLLSSDAVGNWLWRQGSTQLGQAGAWWINFGTFVTAQPPAAAAGSSSTPAVQLTGFQGIGALGGGNVTVVAGTDAGQITDRQGDTNLTTQPRGEGLVIAVGSTGRVVSTDGTQSLVETGGGSLTLHVAGTINPLDNVAYLLTGANGSNAAGSALEGSLTDLRGDIVVTAGAVGRLDAVYAANSNDPRPASPFTPAYAASGGITLVPGDGTVDIETQRDLSVASAGDPGREVEQSLTKVTQDEVGTLKTTGGMTGFTLWTPQTAITLESVGGNVSPVSEQAAFPANYGFYDGAPTDFRVVYPSQLYASALSGNIAYGNLNTANPVSLELAPSANQGTAFLAAGSISANGLAVDLSGANPQGLSTPFDPAFTSDLAAQTSALTNVRVGGGTAQTSLALFALEPDTPTAAYLSPAAAAAPALFYAASGDILNFTTGETLLFQQTNNETLPQWYLAAKAVRILAGNDIVSSGTRPAAPAGTLQQNTQPTSSPNGPGSFDASGNLFLNPDAQSISVVSAGRDILSGYFYIGGPGLLEVDAGRNIQQIGFSQTVSGLSVQQLAYGSIKSLGSLATGAPVSLTGGAGLYVSAGLGAAADYTAFADLYLNPADQADLALPVTSTANVGKVQQVYAAQLLIWLQQNYGYAGTQADALAYFLDPAHVSAVSQDAFLRGIFFAELLASGRQYNDPNSRFHLSYERGRQAIDALLPGANGQTTTVGAPAGYVGAITMSSGTIGALGQFDAGVATEHGGDVQVIDPGGQVVLGTSGGVNPGGGTGIITNGSGNIAVFSSGSDLLGKSRIFTNAGGNIQIWSSTGDINAGIGARTTVVFNPPVISYDNTGGLVETPAVPTSGAGIATQQPLPSVPPGDIDLTAPAGTIDAGEAGVRSSGNLNLAAARLANTSGFSAGGKTSGNSAPASVSLTSVEAAGAAAGAGQQAAQNLSGARTENQLPSIVEVDVLSVSGETDDQKRKRRGL